MPSLFILSLAAAAVPYMSSASKHSDSVVRTIWSSEYKLICSDGNFKLQENINKYLLKSEGEENERLVVKNSKCQDLTLVMFIAICKGFLS